jgi:hypothetical protein
MRPSPHICIRVCLHKNISRNSLEYIQCHHVVSNDAQGARVGVQLLRVDTRRHKNFVLSRVSHSNHLLCYLVGWIIVVMYKLV